MKKIIALVFITTMLQTSAYANVASYKTECEVDGAITISGSFDTEEAPQMLGLRILKADKDFSDLTGDAESDFAITDYISQIEMTPEQKSFTISLVLSDENSCIRKARLLGTGFSEPTDIELQYVKLADYNGAVATVVSALSDSREAFNQACKEGDNLFYLGFNEAVSKDVLQDNALDIIYNTAEGVRLKANDRLSALRLWRAASVVDLLNRGFEVDLKEYIYCLEYFGEDIKGWIDFVINKDSNEPLERFMALISNRGFESLNEFEKGLKEALILTVNQYHGGIVNIGKVISDFSDITKITAKNESYIYQKIGGNRYSDIETLLKAYNEAKESGKGGSSSSGGGSGSGGGGSNTVLSTGVINSEKNPQKETIALTFTDLDMTPWAYEAVSTLFDKGIIGGKSDAVFAPLDSVTREEFIKILVCASGYENKNYNTGRFQDIQPGAWYEKYVCIASENGIVDGIEENRFGVGEKISRQDMAVMIYRLLNLKNTAPPAAEVTFSDSDMISEYAKEAVGALAGGGMVNGIGDNLFSPSGTATRAEAAQMVFNVLEFIR